METYGKLVVVDTCHIEGERDAVLCQGPATQKVMFARMVRDQCLVGGHLSLGVQDSCKGGALVVQDARLIWVVYHEFHLFVGWTILFRICFTFLFPSTETTLSKSNQCSPESNIDLPGCKTQKLYNNGITVPRLKPMALYPTPPTYQPQSLLRATVLDIHAINMEENLAVLQVHKVDFMQEGTLWQTTLLVAGNKHCLNLFPIHLWLLCWWSCHACCCSSALVRGGLLLEVLNLGVFFIEGFNNGFELRAQLVMIPPFLHQVIGNGNRGRLIVHLASRQTN